MQVSPAHTGGVIGVIICFLFVCGNGETPLNTRTTVELSQWQLGWPPVSAQSVLHTERVPTAAKPHNWLNVTVPCTVLACLAQTSNVSAYGNPFYNVTLDDIPSSLFEGASGVWYRTFVAPPDVEQTNDSIYGTLRFSGINYRANLFVNGVAVANKSTFVGTFSVFDFDIKLSTTKTNLIEVQVWVVNALFDMFD